MPPSPDRPVPSAPVATLLPDPPHDPEPTIVIPDPDPNPEPAPIIPDPDPNPEPAPIIPDPAPESPAPSRPPETESAPVAAT